MLDPQRIIEELQAAVASPDSVDWDLLRDAAAEYAGACAEVNERLSECQRLLKQGLRSEALQVAEREPNLLDSVALLDFAELEQWRQLLLANRMVAPPTLRIDVASDLNAAYAEEAPLSSLLKQHRLLALGRAPLAARIGVLRQIRLGDVMNPVWTDDLGLLEKARHQEIQRELESACHGRHVERVAGLAHELASGDWVYAPPAQLVTQARQRHQRLAASLAAEEMARIETELSRAYTALDVEAGRASREKWETCEQIADLSDTHPLVQRAAAALAWLDSEDDRQKSAEEFAAAVAKLENALQTDTSRESLERLFHAACRFDEELPPRLARRYHDRLHALDLTARRRSTLAVVASVAGVVLVAAVVAWYLYDAQREEAIVAAAAALAKLVDDQNATEGQRYYDDLQRKDPALAARPEIQQELGRLNGLVAAEDNRRKSFEGLLERAIKAGLEEPERAALFEAEKLARSLDEKSRSADWRAKVNAADRERQQKRTQRFEADFQGILADVERLEQGIQSQEVWTGADATQMLARIEQARARIENTKQGASGLTAALVGQLDPLRIRADALRRQVTDSRRQQTSLENMTAAVGKAEAYSEALATFLRENSSSPLSGGLKTIADEAKWWLDIERWAKFYGDYRLANLGKISAKDARELLMLAEPLVKEAGDSPLAAAWNDKLAYLQHVANRVDPKGKPRIDVLEGLFDDRRINGLWMLKRTIRQQTKQEQWCYFLTSEPDLRNAASDWIPMRVITGFDLSEKTENLRKDEITNPDRSPQAKIATAAQERQLFRRLRDGEWDQGIFNLLQLIADHKDLDPLLHLILLRRIVEVGRQGSHSLDEALAPLWTGIDGAQVDLTANWLWPADENGQKSRRAATDLLAKLVSAHAYQEYAARSVEILRRDVAPLTPCPKWVGWLRPASGSSWMSAGPGPLPTSGELRVVARVITAGELPGWHRVGVCQAKGVKWDVHEDGRFAAGRPLYHFPQ